MSNRMVLANILAMFLSMGPIAWIGMATVPHNVALSQRDLLLVQMGWLFATVACAFACGLACIVALNRTTALAQRKR